MTTDDRPFPAELPIRLRKVRLRRTEAAEYAEIVHGIPIAPATLARLASVGGGPPVERFGRTVFYRRTDLDQWIDGRIVREEQHTRETTSKERQN
ncbi:hypothetical protein ABIE65_001395 [Constrictibacter sp. MBR-5]|jgi:hypothetical protein|uniref:helix-turn-helix transcriptional regulator n=1 Tax=Constrictibacter sp. MBR-5 TaxID=3156467 RepID=UPI0033984EE1